MKAGTILLAGALLWYAVTFARDKAREMREDKLPEGVVSIDPKFRHFGLGHYDACMRDLKAFASQFRLTLRHGQCTRAAVMDLHNIRQEVLCHMYALRMRLPNDLDAEVEFTQHIEDTDKLLRYYIQDAQTRGNLGLLLPHPIDDTMYRQHYRAANDIIM